MEDNSNNSSNSVMSSLLDSTDLNENRINKVLSSMYTNTVDEADLYFQMRRHESWQLEDGKIKEGSFNIQQGVGARVISGEKTGFSYSDELILPALEKAAGAARAITRQGQSRSVHILPTTSKSNLYPKIDPTSSITDKEKIELLHNLDDQTRKLDKRIEQVMISLNSCQDLIMIATSDGNLVTDVRPLVRLSINVIMKENDRREQAYTGGGARTGLEYFRDSNHAVKYAHEAVRQAVIQLEAIPAPAGTMPVILGPGWPGILLHEAVGHGLEGDFNRKGVSTFSGRIGEKVASPLCTIVDDGTIPNRRGSLAVDDEGTPGNYNTLIENGILRGYMQDKLNARLMGVSPTGNGRRESFAHVPMPRMTNTYMLPGPHDPEEILRSVKNGIYAPSFSGGQVDITSGKFVFSVNEAYLIKDGKLQQPIKGAMLIGDGPEILNKISMVGNDLQFDSGIGSCGKEGQTVPVGVGQPTLRVDEITVGGTT